MSQKEDLYRTLAQAAFVHWLGKLVVLEQHGSYVAYKIHDGILGNPLSTDQLQIALLQQPEFNAAKPGDIKAHVLPRWYAMAMANPATGAQIEAVRPFVWATEALGIGQWAWHRLPMDPNPNAEIPPLWLDLVQRMKYNTGDTYMLWWGMTFFPDKFPRDQYLFLQGSGGDGKSSAAAALKHVFRENWVAELSSANIRGEHSLAALEHTGLLFFNEDNNSSFMSSSLFKTLTGDETITINPKYERHRRMKIQCRIVINSNNKPTITGQKADYRRLLYIPLEPPTNPEISNRYRADLRDTAPQFLQVCHARAAAWLAANPGKGALDLPTAARKEIEEESVVERVKQILFAEVTLDASAEERAKDVDSMLVQTFGRHTLEYKIARQVLTEGARRVQRGDGVRVWQGVRLVSTGLRARIEFAQAQN